MFLSSVHSFGWGCASVCQADGGMPAYIGSDADTLRLRALMEGVGRGRFAWLNVFNWPPTNQPSGNWGWPSSSVRNYTNWVKGEPDDTSGEENCVMVVNSAQWMDEQCFQKAVCVCNTKLNPFSESDVMYGEWHALHCNCRGMMCTFFSPLQDCK